MAASSFTPDAGTFTLPDGFNLTLAWWHNAQITRRRRVGGQAVDATVWAKHLSHGRPFSSFTAGQIEPHPQGYGGRCARPEELHDGHGPNHDGHQVAIICAPHTQVFAVDVDDPVAYATSQLSQVVTLAHAASRRGEGWHALVYVPPELLNQFPTQGPIPGGDVKANGFVPLPGSVHHGGEAYAPQVGPGRGLVVATAALLGAAGADRAGRQEQLRGQGDGSSAGEGDEPALFAYTGQLVALGLSEAEAWARWLARAEALVPRDPTWPWSAADRYVFERQWDYCSERHVAHHGQAAEPVSAAQLAWAEANRREAESDGEGVTQPAGEGASADLDDVLDPPPTDPTLTALWGEDAGYRVPTAPVWYELRPDGVVSTEGPGDDVVYLAFRPLIVAGLRVTEDGTERYELAWLDRDAQRRTVILGAEDVSSANLARAFPVTVVNPRKTARLAEYLAHCVRVNEDLLRDRRSRVASSLGWLDGPGDQFVAGPGRPCAVEDVKNTGDWLTGHRESGDLTAWRDAVWACETRPLVLILVLAGLAAPLLRRVGAAAFAVDVSGSTSTGKTISQLLSAAAWGDPRQLVLSWQNTAVASEHYLSVLRGLPLYLSESQLASEAGVEQLVYSLVEGRSKGRSRQDGAGLLDARRFETVVISSGERPLTSFTKKGGVVPRVVTLAGEPFDSAANAEAARDAARASHGHAGPAFVAAALQRGDAWLAARHQSWLAYLRAGLTTPVASRRAESVAVLALAADVAGSVGLTPPLAPATWRWLAEGGGALNDHEEDRPRQALEVLMRAVALSPSSFYVHGGAFPIAPPGGWAGRLEAGRYVAVSPEWLRKLLGTEGFDYETVVTAWRDRGWIRHGSGRNTVSVRMANGPVRLVMVVEGVPVDTSFTGNNAAEEALE